MEVYMFLHSKIFRKYREENTRCDKSVVKVKYGQTRRSLLSKFLSRLSYLCWIIIRLLFEILINHERSLTKHIFYTT